jgi:deoxycytidylate deaminase
MERTLPSIFRLARNVSKHSDHQTKIGAVLVVKGTPIAVGFNKAKTHPDFPFSIHAERDLIRTSGKSFIRGSVVYIYRETKEGLGLARPCADCMKALTNFGVREIIYTTSEYPYFEVEKINKPV